jgi:hypothetical protein
VQVQAVNDLGNLIFFFCLLATVILAVVFIYRKLRGKPTRRIAFAVIGCWSAYAIVLVAASLSSKTVPLALGTDKCFDDWCASVIGSRLLPRANAAPSSELLAITLRISDRALQAAFRPSQPRVMLTLSSGDTLAPSEVGQREFERQAGPQEDLARRLVAGESFQTTLVFELPATTRQASVVVLEGPAAITPFLVGDENSFFHKKIVYPITVD